MRVGDDENKDSEFKDFYNRMKLTEKNRADFQALMTFAKQIGLIYGAIDSKFVNEDNAERLNQPLEIIEVEDDKQKGDYGLRLYCLRIDESNVILFNGDRKTVPDDVMKCDNCRPYFLRANDLAAAIQDAFNRGYFWIEDTFTIKTETGFILKLESYGEARNKRQ